MILFPKIVICQKIIICCVSLCSWAISSIYWWGLYIFCIGLFKFRSENTWLILYPPSLSIIRTTWEKIIKSIALLACQQENLPAMFQLSFLVFNSVLFLTTDFAFAGKCRQINSSVLPACANVDYTYTANFSNIGQKSYQEYVSSEVTLFANRFSSCSPLSETIVCSRYVPKCSERFQQPVLPCREVCEQFVSDCDKDLRDSGLYKRYVAYCRLLSSDKDIAENCFKPVGFVSRTTKGKFQLQCFFRTRVFSGWKHSNIYFFLIYTFFTYIYQHFLSVFWTFGGHFLLLRSLVVGRQYFFHSTNESKSNNQNNNSYI